MTSSIKPPNNQAQRRGKPAAILLFSLQNR
jgi:hypothetical protein